MKKALILSTLCTCAALLASCGPELPDKGAAPREPIVNRGSYAETMPGPAGKPETGRQDLLELLESDALNALWEKGYVPEKDREELSRLRAEMEDFLLELDERLAELETSSLDAGLPDTPSIFEKD